ncbi:MAG TPA: MBL fold metallo-hydrolase [Vicinamibacterales bacterium]|nr:MBL fold metallo-hydrolase [Vicinamibacterales bacterium]
MDIVPLSPQLCFLRFPAGHVYVWRDDDGLTLIDSGVPGSAASIADAIRQLGHRPAEVRRLVLTHFHIDHVGGAAEIAAWGPVEVIAHGLDAPVIRGEAAGPPPNLLDWERPLFDRLRIDGVPDAVRVDRVVDADEVLDFGGGARVVTTPGHTPGSIAIHLPAANVVIAGDAAARLPDGQVIVGVFNCDPGLARRSLGRLAELNPAVVCFGHGEPLTEHATALLREAAERAAG